MSGDTVFAGGAGAVIGAVAIRAGAAAIGAGATGAGIRGGGGAAGAAAGAGAGRGEAGATDEGAATGCELLAPMLTDAVVWFAATGGGSGLGSDLGKMKFHHFFRSSNCATTLTKSLVCVCDCW